MNMVERTKALKIICIFLAIAAGVNAWADGWANPTSENCRRNALSGIRDYLRQRRAVRRTRDMLTAQGHTPASDPSVSSLALEFVREIDGATPETHRYEFRMLRNTLYSTVGYLERNPHGSPQWINHNLSPAVARYLGLEIRQDGTVIYPSAAYLQQRIARLNERLRASGRNARVALGFYDDAGKAGHREYLTRYHQEGALPISRDLVIHDLNYHLSAILIPEDIMTQSRNQVEYAVRWMQFVEERIAAANFSPAQREALQATISRIESVYVTSIDVGTGNFSFNSISMSDPNAVLEQAQRTLLRGSHSSSSRLNETLEETILSYLGKTVRSNLRTEFGTNEFTEFTKLRQWLVQQNTEFMSTLPEADQARFQQTRPVRRDQGTEVTSRRRSLEAAAILLQQQ